MFYDSQWHKNTISLPVKSHASNLIESVADNRDVQGAFWTFTPAVLEKVGYFDLQRFCVCFFGHRDYTFRCCKAGFNDINNVFDLKNSKNFLELNKIDYIPAPDRSLMYELWGHKYKEKMKSLKDSRIFVPYNDVNYDLFGNNNQILLY